MLERQNCQKSRLGNGEQENREQMLDVNVLERQKIGLGWGKF